MHHNRTQPSHSHIPHATSPGTVLFFNAVENRSSEWGVAPFHWYFTSALPRALLGAVVLIPVRVGVNLRVWADMHVK